ncbi:MAG TPA: hypothetical protein VFT06_10410 [Flavisolibacter sp.]|nr:hypothetical protein [Flavisolibacter sp.]
MSKPANYMHEQEAAEMLRIAPKTLRVYVYGEKKKKMPYQTIRYKKLNRDVVVYSKSDIEAILNF